MVQRYSPHAALQYQEYWMKAWPNQWPRESLRSNARIWCWHLIMGTAWYNMVKQKAAKTRKAKCPAQHEVCSSGRKSCFLWNQAPFRTQLAAINSRWLLSPITLPKFRLCTGVHTYAITCNYQLCARNAVMAHLWPTGSSDQIVEWVSCRA